MAIHADGPAILSFVTRQVDGDVSTTQCRFDKKKGEKVRKDTKLEEPVIVFMPNGSSQIMSRKKAEKKGFLDKPDILNFDSINDAKTIAGKFKFAFTDKEKKQYWLEMENQVISACISTRGHPLPKDVTYDERSLFLSALFENEEVMTNDA